MSIRIATASTALAVFALLLGGCATVTTKPDPEGAREAGANDGITYFLPRQLATVAAKRTESRLSKAVMAVAKAQGAVTSAEALVDTRQTEVEKARAALVSAPDNDTARRLLQEQLTDAEADLRAARRSLDDLRGKLDTATEGLKTEVAAGRSTAPGAYDVSLSISLLDPSADPIFAYRLDPRHSALRDDEHKLTLGRNGLLTTANTVAADRTGDVLLEVATFAGAISGNPLGFAAARDGEDPDTPKKCTESPDEFTGIVDFASASQVKRLNYDLQCLGVRLTVDGRTWAQSTRPVPNRKGDIEGIVYRTPVEVQVTVEKCTAKEGNCTETQGWYPTQVIALALPQAGPISVVRQDAGLMTKSTYALAFDNGMLTSFASNRPSEVLEVARTPMRLVQGLFDGVSKVISLRTGQANDLAGLSAAELALTNARAAEARAAISNQRLLSAEELALANALAAEQVAAISNQRQLSEAEQQLMQQLVATQYAEQLATLKAQQTVTTADRDLLQALWQLQSAGVTGQTQLITDQLGLQGQQTALQVAGINAPVQISAAQLAATLALTRDQARLDALERCVAQQILATPAGQTPVIDACLAP